MSKVALSLKIDVSKIDKARLFNGQKGVYLDATIFVDLDQLDQYGNSGMITQDVSKDEKAQGVKGNILGNGKVFWKEQTQQQGGFNQGQQQGGYNQQQSAPQQQQAPQQQAVYNKGDALKNNQTHPSVNTNGATDFSDDLPF